MKRLCPVAVLTMLVTIAAGCASGPEPSIAHIHGEPLEVPARPSDAACDARLRSEPLAAQRIRADLVSALLSVDPAVVNAVAADPTASTALLGIPLTVIEANQVRASGIALDDTLALSYWVSVGAPERFGGIWIDPPGSNHFVVAIPGGDPDTIGLARCLEGGDVRYVWAAMSLATGEALMGRISQDTDSLRAAGIEANFIDFDETKGFVVVGVPRPTVDIERILVERYGPGVHVIQADPGQPLGAAAVPRGTSGPPDG